MVKGSRHSTQKRRSRANEQRTVDPENDGGVTGETSSMGQPMVAVQPASKQGKKKKGANSGIAGPGGRKTKGKRKRIQTVATTEEGCQTAEIPDEAQITPHQTRIYLNFIEVALKLGIEGITKQFNELKSFMPPGFANEIFLAHMPKNRYKDVQCNDRTRVILPNGGYVHANYVQNDPFVSRFIATQAPMSTSLLDFWTMCVQERAPYIFMLCQTVEDGKEKSFQYWPKDKGQVMNVGDFTITATNIRSEPGLVITDLEVKQGGHLTLNTVHVNYMEWPDHDVPKTVTQSFEMLKMARSQKTYANIVHCSAGIGRTGAFLAIELCYQWILSLRPLDVPSAIKYLRSMRMHCVQTPTQLVFLYRALIAQADTLEIIPQNYRPHIDKFIAEYDRTIANDQARAQARNNAKKAIAESANAVVARTVRPAQISIKSFLPPPQLLPASTPPITSNSFFSPPPKM